MFELIERLRAKSESTKKKIAFLAAFSLAGIIFIIWLSVVYPDWKNNQSKEDSVSKLEPSPISAFEETLSNSFSAIGGEFNKLKASISSFSTSPEYYSTTSTNVMGTTTGE